MAKMLGLFLVFGLAMAAMALRPSTMGPQDAGSCDNDVQQLLANCQQYVMFPANPKIAPSDVCCHVVQGVNMTCICSKVTKEVEKIVCMEKVVYVADYCQRPFKPGSKCGSYPIPPVVG